MPPAPNPANDPIWSHFRDPVGHEPVKGTDKRRRKYCKLCPQTPLKVWGTTGTTNAKSHLNSKHGITIEGPRSASSREASQRSIQDAFRTTPSRPAFDQARYTRAMTLLTTRRRIPFSACEWPEWQELCASLNEAASDQLIKSRRTMGRRIDVAYNVFRAQLKQELHEAQSMIHFQVDLWTSQARTAFLGITVQWVDSDFNLQKALLALPRIRSDHSGKNQAALVLEAISSFDIGSQLGYFTGDNATSNDTCLQELALALKTRDQVS
jgi:hypothetical protein